MWSLPAARRAIIVAGCLAAAYTQLTTSPATVAFAREMGANEFHMGVLGALPTLMLFCQFLAAVAVNQLTHRRWVWFWTAMVHRLMLLPVALGPWLLPHWPGMVWVWMLLGATAVSQALLHFSSPLWLSWMGDYLPHHDLSRFWGRRQFWMQWTSAAALGVAAVLRHRGEGSELVDFTWQIVIGTALGVADLCCFFWVSEPPVARVGSPRWRQVFAEPFRHRDFRRFIGFTCFWHLATMAGAPFISLYLLSEVGMDLFHVLMLWTVSWVGGALCSHRLGRWADQYGARPVLVFCVAFKSLNMMALLLVPPQPQLAFALLVPVFMADQVLNCGILIANNGFMIKNSPAENRTMYIAASTALAGLVGGVTSLVAGWGLTQLADVRFEWFGRTWGHFHLLFALSAVLRWVAWGLVHALREPHAQRTAHIFGELMGALPWRILLFPVGLYRSFTGQELQLAEGPESRSASAVPRPLGWKRWTAPAQLSAVEGPPHTRGTACPDSAGRRQQLSG